jgi:hypothetical protein
VIIHSDSTLSAIAAFLVLLAFGSLILLSVLGAVRGRFRRALKLLVIAVGSLAVYTAAVMVVSLASPQKIVDIGDSYCYDNWCIAIEKVNATPQGNHVTYRTEVRIFSDANGVQTSARGASIYLVDERGRRFPLVDDPAVTPLDTELAPHQAVRTSLTFVAASDTRQLFLTGDSGSWSLVPALGLGNDASLLHKRTLLRVL